jgi:eukaryotic-like serine/threonine-protein kinase
MDEQSNSDISMKLHNNVDTDADFSGALPRHFGRLILLRKLARGGMGEVYLAASGGIEGAERACVVKKIRREHQEDKSFRARFLDETRIQAQLQHPGVAQIVDSATDEEDCPYAVVEYVEGRHLGEIVARSNQVGIAINWADAVAIGVCFADALAHIHERKDPAGRPLDIAHRDLSPQNIMVGYGGDVKLIDFGTARGENRRCRTVSGIVYAKPGYVAPEVANQIPGGAPADIYAMGVMLWEMVSGRRFLQGDAVEHQAQVAHGNRPLPRLAPEMGCPERLDEILFNMTAHSLEARYGQAKLAVLDLVTLLKSAPSLADGDRSVRGRIAHMMSRLYPAEPARSRADFARRVSHARSVLQGTQRHSSRPGIPEPSPAPPAFDAAGADGLLPGTRYRLTRRLSNGGMGEVWEACHVDLGRTIALKLMPEVAVQSGAARQKFRSEARALARVRHPGLVEIHDFGVTAEGRCFYAMELLHGQTLEDVLKAGPISWQRAVRYVCDAAQALGAAHAAGIIHRDITPSNLFLTSEGEIKLLDFGVSRSLRREQDESVDAPMVVGTPEYISPEQAAGGPADIRSDIYSLGVVFYEMLTGRVPHPLGSEGAPTLPALLTSKITVVPPLPTEVAPGRAIPKNVEKALLLMLQRDADKRFSATAQLLQALRPLAERRTERRRSGRSRLVVLSAAASFLSVISVGWALHAHLTPRDPAAPALASLLADAHKEAQAGQNAPAASDGAAQVIDLDAPELAGTIEGTPASSASPVVVTAPVDPLTPEVDEILELKERGARINAHHKMKALWAQHPNNVEVARGLSQTAQGVSAWGEAYSAAQFWADQSGSRQALLALAKLQKATLRGNPMATLHTTLEKYPDFAEARALLEKYLSDEKLAAR